MAVTRDFNELVQKRVARDPAFAGALLRKGIVSILAGDVDTGKAILRDYIKATVRSVPVWMELEKDSRISINRIYH